MDTSLDRETGKYIGQGLHTVGSNVGLGASVAGVSAAVAKGISKSSLPPIQRAGIIIGAAMAGAGIHIGSTAINRKNSIIHEINEKEVSKSLDIKNVNNFLDRVRGHSPIEDLTLSIEILNSVCLFLVMILLVQILFRFFLNENRIKFDISNFIGSNLNKKLNYYTVKLIILNKNMNSVYIWITFLVLLVSLYFSTSYSVELHNNLDDYIKVYLNR